MSTIVLEVPDELAERLAPVQERLPHLLAMALDLWPGTPAVAMTAASEFPVYREMLDFLASGPAPGDILAYKVSPSAQARVEALLDRNSEGQLSVDEEAELEAFSQVNHIMLLLKARARKVALPA